MIVLALIPFMDCNAVCATLEALLGAIKAYCAPPPSGSPWERRRGETPKIDTTE